MRQLRQSLVKTPSITKEAKIFDTMMEGVQEGIKVAVYLDEAVKQAENISKQPKETLKETTNGVAEDIIYEKENEEEFIGEEDRY